MSWYADVIGQREAVSALRAHLERTGGAGSTLVVGPEGVGRFLLAHRTARAILGTDAAAAARVDAGNHPDLHILDPEVGIDGVREARKELGHRPVEGPRSVLILRDADRMSLPAHNALLKTLEEPPEGACLFVIARAPEFLPETVVSRCRTVRATSLDESDCREVLRRLGVPEAAAVDAEGSPGRALYQHEHGISEEADRLLSLLAGREADPLAAAEGLARSRSGEDLGDVRRRTIATLRVVAVRLRSKLPQSENALRSVVLALGSLEANASPTVVFADLALLPWTRKTEKANRASPNRR